MFSEEDLRRLDEDDAENRRQLEHLRQMDAKAPRRRAGSDDATAAASAGGAAAAAIGCDGGGSDGG
jgi:hypothetical protein